jgi:hypothetical protein
MLNLLDRVAWPDQIGEAMPNLNSPIKQFFHIGSGLAESVRNIDSK